MCPTNIKFSWLRMGIQYPEDVPKMEITLEPGIFYSNLTATRMEDVENMEEMEETSMTIPQYVVLYGYNTATYTGWTEWKKTAPNS